MMKVYMPQENKLAIYFRVPKTQFLSMIQFLKTLKGREFHAMEKIWTVDNCVENLIALKEKGFKKGIIPFSPNSTIPIEIPNYGKTPFKEVNVKALPPHMFPYQIDAVKFLEAVNGNGIIGDEMGCISGSTLMRYGYLKRDKHKWHKIYYKHGAKFTMRQFFEIYSKKRFAHRSNYRYTFYLFSKAYNANYVREHTVYKVSFKGLQQTFTVTLENGASIRVTEDHPFLVEGWTYERLRNLKIGDKVGYVTKNPIIDFIPIKEITPYGIEDVYDITMVRHSSNNFVANGFVLHNCGKTLEALAYIKLHPEYKRVLIVCPATLKFVWENEIAEWVKQKADIIRSSYDTISAYKSRFLIVSYNLLDTLQDELVKIPFDVIIGDEIHYIANPTAKRTKAFIKLAKKIPHKILLSGTPIRNYPANFFTALNLVAPQVFKNRRQYYARYCDLKWNGFAWTYTGATNTEELHNLVKPFMIRRLKKDVLKDLPEKLRIVVPFEMEETFSRQYENATETFLEWVEKYKNMSAPNVEALRQIAYHSKRNAVISWLEDFLTTDKKLVIFAWHKETIKDLAHVFKNVCVTVDGDVPVEERKARIDKFLSNEHIKFFIGQIAVAGVGLTLVNASDVAFVELPWTPADILQAEDRVARIGQKNKVSVYYLVAKDTIEEDIALLVDRKYSVINTILDGGNDSMFAEEPFIMEIIERTSHKYRSKTHERN